MIRGQAAAVDLGQLSGKRHRLDEPAVVATSSKTGPMTLLENHPEKNIIRAQLRQNILLKDLGESDRAELESHLAVVDGNKGDFLLHQGVRDMAQYFVVDGILKRVVSNAEGREMILRFAVEGDFETSYAAWRLNATPPFLSQPHRAHRSTPATPAARCRCSPRWETPT